MAAFWRYIFVHLRNFLPKGAVCLDCTTAVPVSSPPRMEVTPVALALALDSRYLTQFYRPSYNYYESYMPVIPSLTKGLPTYLPWELTFARRLDERAILVARNISIDTRLRQAWNDRSRCPRSLQCALTGWFDLDRGGSLPGSRHCCLPYLLHLPFPIPF